MLDFSLSLGRVIYLVEDGIYMQIYVKVVEKFLLFSFTLEFISYYICWFIVFVLYHTTDVKGRTSYLLYFI
jgi:hypothetical protein